VNPPPQLPELVLTIGHSNRSLDEFLRMLEAHRATMVADVRKMPRSRANPQFNTDTLPAALAERGIGYTHFPGLGGLRRGSADSPNGAWENASFRAFADYMLTPEFERALENLFQASTGGRPALMCAEAVPWRCHRSVIADALVVRGLKVEHIMSADRSDPHKLREWAVVEGTRITYPPVTKPGENLTLFES
jgi:uncharacterized protein (DUF488 family)